MNNSHSIINKYKSIHFIPLIQNNKKSRIQSFIFYLIFYIILFGFTWSLLELVMWKIIDGNKPNLTGLQSSLNHIPGLSIVPITTTDVNLIAYKNGRPDSYLIYQDTMFAFLMNYELKSQNQNYLRDCLNINDTIFKSDYHTLIHSSCIFKLDWSYRCNLQRNYGYNDGSPCFILKINRIYGWLPSIKTNQKGIKVCCYPTHQNDADLIGNLCMYDAFIHSENGCNRNCALFPHEYFPYLNQENYQSPLVFIELREPKKNVIIQMHCKLIDIQNSMSVEFAILID